MLKNCIITVMLKQIITLIKRMSDNKVNNVCKAKELQSIHKDSAELVQKNDIAQHKRKKCFHKKAITFQKKVIKGNENFGRVSAERLAAVF